MDHVYGNVDFELSKTPGKETRPGSKEVSDHTGHTISERKPPSSRETLKVLLVVRGLLLLCSLVALCVLGFLYSSKGASYEALSEQNIRAVERLEVQEHNCSALISELRSSLAEVHLQYGDALKQLDSFKGCQRCSPCGEGWRSHGKCYYFSTDELNWAKSRARCAEKGGHLVIITSPAEQSFVSSNLGENHWIGLNDLETEGKWTWVNGQSLSETGVEFWHKRKDVPDEPDNWKAQDPTGENCAALGNEGGNTDTWFDASCAKLKKYVCEK